MIYNKLSLKASAGKELKFRNDLGSFTQDGSYIFPDFFVECFPAKSLDTIEKLEEMFEEISLDDKINHIEECKAKLKNEEE